MDPEEGLWSTPKASPEHGATEMNFQIKIAITVIISANSSVKINEYLESDHNLLNCKHGLCHFQFGELPNGQMSVRQLALSHF